MEINLHTISGNPNAMERELILALKKNAGNKERLNAEISIFKKILPVIESFANIEGLEAHALSARIRFKKK